MRKKSVPYLWIMLPLLLGACTGQAEPASITSPAIVPATPLPTSTEIFILVPPSPMPTQPVFPVITPDPVQIERWNEYEEALARAFFKSSFRPEEFVCEWEIVGRAEQEVYVYAICSGIYSAPPYGGSIPAVIHLRTDGAVERADIPGAGTSYASDIRQMFPPDIHGRIFDHLISFQGMDDRLRWRRGHPDEPPLIILNSLSTSPTPVIIPWVTPDLVQVEKWREYQTALAEPLSYLPPEQMLCEWELLGQSGNEVYVWAICGEIAGGRVGLEGLLRVDLAEDGSVLNVTPSGTGGQGFPSEILKIFPTDVAERYFRGEIHFQELVDHLRWRQQLGREEPPLLVLRTTPNP